MGAIFQPAAVNHQGHAANIAPELGEKWVISIFRLS